MFPAAAAPCAGMEDRKMGVKTGSWGKRRGRRRGAERASFPGTGSRTRGATEPTVPRSCWRRCEHISRKTACPVSRPRCLRHRTSSQGGVRLPLITYQASAPRTLLQTPFSKAVRPCVPPHSSSPCDVDMSPFNAGALRPLPAYPAGLCRWWEGFYVTSQTRFRLGSFGTVTAGTRLPCCEEAQATQRPCGGVPASRQHQQPRESEEAFLQPQVQTAWPSSMYPQNHEDDNERTVGLKPTPTRAEALRPWPPQLQSAT